MAYTGAFVFGDSLVDSGNALKLAQWYGSLPFTDLPEGAPTANLGYFAGRFSDGYTFADLISNKTIGVVTQPVFPYDFEDPVFGVPIDPFAGDPSGKNLNFAYGGAQIRQGSEVVPDLDGQTDAFKDAVDGHADSNALYMVTMGGNDVRSLAPIDANPTPQADAYAALDHAANTLFTELRGLVNVGVHNILITGIPDVGLIPDYDRDGSLVLDATEQMRAAAATDYSIYLDTLIRTVVVPQLQALGANVTYVPVMSYVDANGTPVVGGFDAIVAEIAALHGLTAEQLTSDLLLYQNLVFFDDIHPNAQAHALIGSYMYSQLTGTPWIETMPLAGSDVDYRLTATIGAAGEVDSQSIYLIAGTTYTFEMLGISSLGSPGSLGDTMLKLLNANGVVVGMDDDSGVGFDSHLTFTATSSGAYTLQMSAVGMLTGSYAMQAALIGGTALTAGNTYTVNNASTLVLEPAGGIGQDIVKASVSYKLSAGSEIEVLRTTKDLGTSAINLTGNEFSQTIVGNRGSNILEGKGGADVLTGGAGKDTFILSNVSLSNPGAANIDRITDYARGEIVDVTQILTVAPGTNVLTGGYLRVTTSGLIQVDVDGGGNNWVTLSTVNGTVPVTVRYMSGATATTVSVSRVAETQLATAAANTNTIMTGAIAAAGLTGTPAAAEIHHGGNEPLALASESHLDMPAHVVVSSVERSSSAEANVAGATVQHGNVGHAAVSTYHAESNAMHTQAFVPEPVADVRHFEQASSAHAPASVLPVAPTVAMPSAEMLQALASHGSGVATNASDVGHVLADALSGGGAHADIDALLEFGLGHEATHAELAAGHFTAGFASHDLAVFAGVFHEHPFLGVEMLEAHHAAAPAA